MADAAGFIQRNQIETYWDKTTSQNYGEYDDGETLYQVWLEDAESLEVKMGLIKEYSLAGVASWKLGFEQKNIWKVLSNGLS